MAERLDLQIQRPNIFPECATCPVAGSQILTLARAKKGCNTQMIGINCVRQKLIFWDMIAMQANRIGDDNGVVTMHILPIRIVTNQCPGLKNENK